MITAIPTNKHDNQSLIKSEKIHNNKPLINQRMSMNSVDDESSSDDDSYYDDDAFKFMVLGFTLKQPRKSCWVHKRVDWDKHVTK